MLVFPDADRHVVDISFTVCLFVCLFVHKYFVMDISGVGWRRAMEFGRMVDGWWVAGCNLVNLAQSQKVKGQK